MFLKVLLSELDACRNDESRERLEEKMFRIQSIVPIIDRECISESGENGGGIWTDSCVSLNEERG